MASSYSYKLHKRPQAFRDILYVRYSTVCDVVEREYPVFKLILPTKLTKPLLSPLMTCFAKSSRGDIGSIQCRLEPFSSSQILPGVVDDLEKFSSRSSSLRFRSSGGAISSAIGQCMSISVVNCT